MSIESLLIHECSIIRHTVSNSGGENSTSDSTIATGVQCLLQEQLGRITGHPSGQVLKYDAILFLLPETDIKPQASDDDFDSVQMTEGATGYFKVLHVGDESGQGHHLTAKLMRVRQL